MTLGDGLPIVLDNGSSACKAGFAGDGEPRALVPAVVGNPKPKAVFQVGEGYRAKVGEKIFHDSSLRLSWPVEHGVVTNWEEIEEIWRETFDLLEVSSDQHPILLTEAALNPKVHREMMAVLMFEEFAAPAIHIGLSGALALYASGSSSGVVVEVGDGVSQTVPIYDNFVLTNAVQRIDLGGRDLTEHLASKLRASNSGFDASFHSLADAQRLKESMCYVSQSFNTEHSKADFEKDTKVQSFPLPDGRSLWVTDSDLIDCPEVLFDPTRAERLQREDQGLHQMTYKSIRACEVDVQKALTGNIVLSGGTMMFPGMTARFSKELSGLMPSTMPTRAGLVRATHAKYGAFVGGSILSSLSSMSGNWISRSEYEEHGVSVIHTRSVSLTDPGQRG